MSLKLEELLFLKSIRGLGKVRINKEYVNEIKYMNSLKEVRDLVIEKKHKKDDIDLSELADIARMKAQTYENMSDIKVITVFDDDYPKQLDVMRDKKPLVLFAKGNLELFNKPNISFIGTRKPSNYSEKIERKLVEIMIKKSQRVIVSGLALGCDKIAHETALNVGGETIAVLPSGIKNIMPIRNKDLANRIVNENGCLISEYAPDEPATKYSYVERDGLIAALSDGIVVIECGVKSGTMHTVEAGEKFKKPVGAFYTPKKYNGSYEGNESILFARKNKGIKIENSDDIENFLKILKTEKNNEKHVEQLSLF